MGRTDKEKEKLNRVQKIEVVIASVLTLSLIIAVSVYAWFTHANNMETMTKIKEPDNLDIRAANFHPVINFDLNGIDIEDMKENDHAEYRIFSVSAGDYKISYKIQLAHTTNIPFKYSLYKATWRTDVTENSGTQYIEYHPLNDSTTISYYEKGEEIPLKTLNADSASAALYGRTLAAGSGTIYDKTYDDASDNPEIYAVPIYMQTENPIVPSSNESENDHDYFILQIEWDEDAADKGLTKWNKAENNKETDIICITASRTTR